MMRLDQEFKQPKGRIAILGMCFMLGLLILAGNLYRLMVVRYEAFLALSIDNQFKDLRLRASRGLILDRRGQILVDARPSFDIFITPAFCQQCVDEVIPKLQAVLGWDEAKRRAVEMQVLNAHGPQRYQPQVVETDLPKDVFDVLLAHQYLLPGVDLDPMPHRNYRVGSTLAHVVGYMNEVTQKELQHLNANTAAEYSPYVIGDYIGRRGIERSLEHILRGQNGWLKQVVNARGEVMRDISGDVLQHDEQPPKPGHNVVLSIDLRLQEEAERVFSGTAGAVVVLESKTGFVLAIVSYPSFDPNEMTGRISPKRLLELLQDPLQPMVFRAGAQHYSPGSTFKVISSLAALRSGSFAPQRKVFCPGWYKLGGRTWRCHRARGHGFVNARRALQVSCDTYFYKVASVLGIDPIARVGKAFGLGSVTRLGIVGEVPGVMPDTDYHQQHTPGGYHKGMALNTVIGQGDVNVTPLQMAVLYAGVANGGTIYKPQIVARVESFTGEVLEAFEPQLVHQGLMSRDEHQFLIDALAAVVNEPGGTAIRSRLPEIKMAGKTGTAQVTRLGAVRLKTHQMDYWERDHAWFVAFAPAEDPEITVVVLNEHGGHGSTHAAPTAAALVRKYFELKKMDAQAFNMPHPVNLPTQKSLLPDSDAVPGVAQEGVFRSPEFSAVGMP